MEKRCLGPEHEVSGRDARFWAGTGASRREGWFHVGLYDLVLERHVSRLSAGIHLAACALAAGHAPPPRNISTPDRQLQAGDMGLCAGTRGHVCRREISGWNTKSRARTWGVAPERDAPRRNTRFRHGTNESARKRAASRAGVLSRAARRGRRPEPGVLRGDGRHAPEPELPHLPPAPDRAASRFTPKLLAGTPGGMPVGARSTCRPAAPRHIKRRLPRTTRR